MPMIAVTWNGVPINQVEKLALTFDNKRTLLRWLIAELKTDYLSGNGYDLYFGNGTSGALHQAIVECFPVNQIQRPNHNEFGYQQIPFGGFDEIIQNWAYELAPVLYDAAWYLSQRNVLRVGVKGRNIYNYGNSDQINYSVTAYGRRWLEKVSEADIDELTSML